MSRRVSSLTNTQTAIAREVNSEYDNVKTVADNIDDVNIIADNISILTELGEDTTVLIEAAVSIESNLAASEIAKDVAEASVTQSVAAATEATTSASNAATSEANAASSETNAAISESNALISANNSEISAQASATSATAASLSESNASTSEVNASLSESLAKEWASNPEDTLVTGEVDKYSALHYAAKASESSIAAATSEVNASSSEVNAANSAVNALASEVNASLSETAAAESEVNAQTSASNAADSEASAATSASNASTSASNALVSENNAYTSETNASNSANAASMSETNAAASEAAARVSETNASVSETNAGVSETNALTSEINSANSATAAASYATSANTSETNAGVSEVNAAASASSAGISATSAANSKIAAATSEANAATSAAEALSSKTDAETAAIAAESYFEQFDDVFLGTKTTDPTTDNDGDPLTEGVIYYNNGDAVGLRVYTSSGWNPAVFNASGAVLSFNNRSGVVTLSNQDVASATGQALDETGTPKFTSIQVTGGTSESDGRMSWNLEDGTIDLATGANTTYQLGQEIGIVVRNTSGGTLFNGSIIKVTGASGNKINAELADNTTAIEADNDFALAAEVITNNSTGKATTEGLVKGLDTSLYSEGTSLWLGTAGGVTDVKPVFPAVAVHIGWVVRSHASEGSIYVRFSKVGSLEDIYDVNLTSPMDDDFLGWDSATNTWINKQVVIPEVTKATIDVLGVDAATLEGNSASAFEPADATILKDADIGVSVQAYDANTVSDGSYVHTDNNYTSAEKAKLSGVETGATADQSANEVPYSNATSSLAATNVQTALDEIDGKIVGLEADDSASWGGIYGTISNQTDLQDALNLKAPLESPAFTGTVKALDRFSVGTSNPRLTGTNDTLEIAGPTSSFHMGVQDGSGRVQMRWNASVGVTPTYLVSSEPSARYEILDVTQPADSLWKIDYASGGTAGSTIPYSNILSLGTSEFTYKGSNVWHGGNDGAGSGLDADKLDGIQASQFLRSDTGGNIYGQLSIRNTNVQLNLVDTTYNNNFWQFDHQNGDLSFRYNGNSLAALSISETGNVNIPSDILVDGAINSKTMEFTKAIDIGGTDLNNLDRSGEFNGVNLINAPEGSSEWFYITSIRHTNSNGYSKQEATSLNANNGQKYYRIRVNGVWKPWVKIYNSDNDGSGSGLDADLLDGVQGSNYLRSDIDDTHNADLTVNRLVTDKIVDTSKRVLNYDFSINPNTAIGDLDDYFDVGEVVELFSFEPTGDSQNYYVEGTVKIQSSYSVQTLFIRSAVRSNFLPDLSVSSTYDHYTATGHDVAYPVWWLDKSVSGTAKLMLKFTGSNIHDIEASFKVFQRSDYGEALTVVAEHKVDTLPTNYVESVITRNHSTHNDNITFRDNTIWHSGNDGSGSGLDADKLDGQEGSYYRNASNLNAGTISDARLPDTISSSITGNSATATKLATARTISLEGDLTGSASFDGSSNITISAAVSNDSHTHTFNNLTDKTSGTGDYATTGDLVSGKGSGGVAITVNDGAGNANVTFNHQDGKPEQAGNAARITVNTDSTTDASIDFQVESGVSAGVMTAMTRRMSIKESGVDVVGDITLTGTVDGRDIATDGSKLDGIEAGATGDMSASEILTAIKTVDGSGSGLDADTVDGVQASYLWKKGVDIPSGANLNSYTTDGYYHQNSTADASAGSNYPVGLAGMLEVTSDGNMVYQRYTVFDGTHTVYIRTRYSSTWYSWAKQWSSLNDGAGSDLDASKLEGKTLSVEANSDTVVQRNSGGDIFARLFRSTYQNESTMGATDAIAFRRSTTDNYTRFCDNKTSVRDWLETYSKAEVESLVGDKQETLVSGSTIKTVNGNSLLGSGNISVSSVPSSFGAIGTITIALVNLNGRGTGFSAGYTIAGSELVRDTYIYQSNTLHLQNDTNDYLRGSSSGQYTSMGLTGTWRVLTGVYLSSTRNNYFPVLVQRIA